MLARERRSAGGAPSVRPEEAHSGMGVRVRETHRILERRGMVGRIVGRYGGEEYKALDVRFPKGIHRLFWPGELEEISPAQSWWRSLFGGSSAQREYGRTRISLI